MSVKDVLDMIGGLALFLYGINVMGEGLKKTSGGKLEAILGKITSNKVVSVLMGALVTAFMQSSSATTVMIVGFVNSGIMELSKAVYVIIGANIGATITPWIMSLGVGSAAASGMSFLDFLKPAYFSPILAIIGVFIILISKKDKNKNLAKIFVGFAVLIFGMKMMSNGVEPIGETEGFKAAMTMFTNPVLGTLVGIALTAIIQSSSATVGMVQVLSGQGLITYGAAIPIMVGANIGTCATALLSSIGTGRNARRSALVHFFYNIVRGILFLIVFYTLHYFIGFNDLLDANASAVGIAAFYTALSIASAVVLFPVSQLFVKMSYKALPLNEEEKEKSDLDASKILQHLDDRFLNSPGLAIEQCKQVVAEMAQYTREGLFLSFELLDEYKDKKANKICDLEDLVDKYEDQLGKYLVKLSSKDMSDENSKTLSMILHCIGDLERISDHSCNIMESAREAADRKDGGFSKKAQEEMKIFIDAIKEIVNMSFDSLINNDRVLASKVEPLEEAIDGINIEIKKHHIKRLRKGKCSIEMGFVLSDVSTNFERVSDHCSNIALSVMQKDEEELGVHEFENAIISKDNEEFARMVMYYSEKYNISSKDDSKEQPVEWEKSNKK